MAIRLRRASFDGLPFHVESGDAEAGHRVATTTIPNGLHVNESFGPQARKYEIEAYCAGSGAHAQAEALLVAAEAAHLGLLVLPDQPSVMVRLTKARRSFEKDKLGLISVSLEAVAEPATAPGGLTANAIEAAIYGVSAGIGGAFGSFAGAAFQLLGQSSLVVEAAMDAAAGVLGDIAALRQTLRLSPAAMAATEQPFAAATAALAAFPAAPAAYGEAVATLAIALGDAADPATLSAVLVDLGAPPDAAPAQVSRGSALVIAANAEQGVALTAAARALALGEASARRSYRDRPEAVTARSSAAAVFDDALARIGRPGLDLARQLSAMAGLVADLAQKREADLAPLITVSAGRPLPSLVWAWALYGDPMRAEEVAARAAAYNPAFLPERFTALAA
ncbi:MAG: hypothetical protein DI527_02090 [Chelatococcus sp.]|nr:MAG: hypothetical protein DI527_02090 [Chelatococcus sp.]